MNAKDEHKDGGEGQRLRYAGVDEIKRTYHDGEDCGGDVSEASLALRVVLERETLGLLSGHDERNRVGRVSGVGVSSLGVEHLLGAKEEKTQARSQPRSDRKQASKERARLTFRGLR